MQLPADPFPWLTPQFERGDAFELEGGQPTPRAYRGVVEVVQSIVNALQDDDVPYRVAFNRSKGGATIFQSHQITIGLAPLTDPTLTNGQRAAILTGAAYHEVGHVLYERRWMQSVQDKLRHRPMAGSASNLAADLMLERRVAKMYPGYAETLAPMLWFVGSKGETFGPPSLDARGVLDLMQEAICALRYPWMRRWSEHPRGEEFTSTLRAWSKVAAKADTENDHVSVVNQLLDFLEGWPEPEPEDEPEPDETEGEQSPEGEDAEDPMDEPETPEEGDGDKDDPEDGPEGDEPPEPAQPPDAEPDEDTRMPTPEYPDPDSDEEGDDESEDDDNDGEGDTDEDADGDEGDEPDELDDPEGEAPDVEDAGDGQLPSLGSGEPEGEESDDEDDAESPGTLAGDSMAPEETDSDGPMPTLPDEVHEAMFNGNEGEAQLVSDAYHKAEVQRNGMRHYRQGGAHVVVVKFDARTGEPISR